MPGKQMETQAKGGRKGAGKSARARKSEPKKDPFDSIDKETKIKMLHYMRLTREIEDRIERKLYRQGKIVGGVLPLPQGIRTASRVANAPTTRLFRDL